jgi:hypothetical protein
MYGGSKGATCLIYGHRSYGFENCHVRVEGITVITGILGVYEEIL